MLTLTIAFGTALLGRMLLEVALPKAQGHTEFMAHPYRVPPAIPIRLDPVEISNVEQFEDLTDVLLAEFELTPLQRRLLHLRLVMLARKVFR
jgi:hypothetical protein